MKKIIEFEIIASDIPVVKPVETTKNSDNNIAIEGGGTTAKNSSEAGVKAPAKGQIKKINVKKISVKKVKLSLKKITGASGYQIAVYKTKKAAKNNKKAIVKKIVTKCKVTIKSKKLKNKKKLYIRVRAYILDTNANKIYGKWSKRKKVTIK